MLLLCLYLVGSELIDVAICDWETVIHRCGYRGMISGGIGTIHCKVSLTEPPVVGAKVTSTDVVSPGASVSGQVSTGFNVKFEPDIE